MTLEAGQKLGPYEIIEQAGAGGMGEVYKANDTRLDRIVAIKVLPGTMALNDDIKARFEREAKSISSLNHPNICILHDIGNENNIDYLVMEFLEGETLAERLKKGPLDLAATYEIAIEICDALNKAHSQGLIHRDLKPGNVMLTKDGAKLMDFGLAKLQISSGNQQGITEITQTTPLTGVGTIVGTMQYMSPEQLEGEEADARSDIFAFGTMLYEMVTGQKAFDGKSQATLIAGIIGQDPISITEMKPMVQPGLDRIVKKCMSKKPEKRWQSANDLGDELRWVSRSGSQAGIPAPLAAKRKFKFNLARLIGAAAIILLLGITYLYYIEISKPIKVVRSHLLAPKGYEYDSFAGGSFALSHDGKKLVFTAMDTVDQEITLWVRALNSLTSIQLPGTKEASFPFWSPDDRYIAFFAEGKLKKILAAGGPTLTLCDANSGRGGSWNNNDIIIFTPTFDNSIHKVSAAGGKPVPITTLDTTLSEVTHRWSKFLPDDNHFIFYSRTGNAAGSENDAVCLGSLDSDKITRLIPARSTITYANGYILYLRESSLMAHPFDPDKLEITGDAFPIAERVTFIDNWSRAIFSASDEGTLIYRSGDVNAGSRLLVYSPEGHIIDTIGELDNHYVAKYSPDESMIAASILDVSSSNNDIWIYNIERNIKNRFTFDESGDISPVWSPDGKYIAFRSDRNEKRAIYIKDVAGLEEIRMIYESDNNPIVTDWSPDGKYLLAHDFDKQTQLDIWVIPTDPSIESYQFVKSNYFDYDGEFSPDGRWVAYGSDESGKEGVYVTPFPGPGSKWQISIDEGDRPRWSADGKTIYYLNNKDEIMKVDVDGSSMTFKAGKVKKMFGVNAIRPGNIYEVSNDEKRILVITNPAIFSTSRVVLVENWHKDIELD